MTKFVLYRNTKDRCEHEVEGDLIEKMLETAHDIEFKQFAKKCEWQTVAQNLGYGRELPIKNDWHVSYKSGKYGGYQCYVLCHSECDFIFLQPDAAKSLQQSFAPKVSTQEWSRLTGYGDHAVDPR